MPAVQCKETLQLDYDYNQQFTKRKIESNWRKYDEQPDEEENPQMLAADFEKILLAPKSIGSHFTFASERDWSQPNDETESKNAAAFQLNLNSLKNGACQLPFYLRHDLSLEMFTKEEIDDMDSRANAVDDASTKKQMVEKKKDPAIIVKSVPAKPAMASTSGSGQRPTKSIQPTDEITKLAKSTDAISLKPTETKAKTVPKAKGKSNEDIQEWLDDILNAK